MFSTSNISASFYTFSLEDIIGLSLLFVSFVIQLIFYLVYYRKPILSAQEINNKIPAVYPKVSVIVESENEVENLAELLPILLDQDYPDFEVIVVNNGSTDESEALLDSLKPLYPSLYSTFVPHSRDTKLGFRKLAFTLGIKAAKGSVILMTEAYCRPESNKWIASIVECLDDKKSVVLGYSYISQQKKLFNSMARFDNLLLSLQYLSAAIKGKPYTGVFRNVAFRKELFFQNKGFAKSLYLENGEDVFLNNVTTEDNTAVCLKPESFTKAIIDSLSRWQKIKKSYVVARSYFRGNLIRLFSFEYLSRYIFYFSFVSILIQSLYFSHFGTIILAGTLFLIRSAIQLCVLGKSATYFKSGKFRFSLPLLDLFQPLYNVRFKTKYRRKHS